MPPAARRVNGSCSPQFHLRRIGPQATKPNVADIMDFHATITMIGRNSRQATYIIDSSNLVQSSIISRNHARLVRQKDNVHRLFDDSLNGIFVNNFKIKGSAVLNEGDAVTFGHACGAKMAPDTWIRQPDSEYQFIGNDFKCPDAVSSRTVPNQRRRHRHTPTVTLSVEELKNNHNHDNTEDKIPLNIPSETEIIPHLPTIYKEVTNDVSGSNKMELNAIRLNVPGQATSTKCSSEKKSDPDACTDLTRLSFNPVLDETVSEPVLSAVVCVDENQNHRIPSLGDSGNRRTLPCEHNIAKIPESADRTVYVDEDGSANDSGVDDDPNNAMEDINTKDLNGHIGRVENTGLDSDGHLKLSVQTVDSCSILCISEKSNEGTKTLIDNKTDIEIVNESITAEIIEHDNSKVLNKNINIDMPGHALFEKSTESQKVNPDALISIVPKEKSAFIQEHTAGCKEKQETDVSLNDKDDLNLDDEDDVNLDDKDNIDPGDKVKDRAACKEAQETDVTLDDKDDVNLDDEDDVNLNDKNDVNPDDEDDVNLDDKDDVILDDEDDVNLTDKVKDTIGCKEIQEDDVNLVNKDDVNLVDKDDVNLDDKDDVNLNGEDDVILTDKVKDIAGCKEIQEADVNVDDEDDVNLNDEDDVNLNDEADVNLNDEDDVNLNDEDDANLDDKEDANLDDEDVNLDDEDDVNLNNEDDVNLNDEDDVNLHDEDGVNLDDKVDVNLNDKDDVNLNDKDDVNLDDEDDANLTDKGDVNLDDEDDVNLNDEDDVNLNDEDDVILDDKDDVNLTDKMKDMTGCKVIQEADVNLEDEDDVNLDDEDDVNLDDEDDVILDDVILDDEDDVILNEADVNLDDKDNANLDDKVKDTDRCKEIQEADVNVDDEDNVDLNDKDDVNLDVEADVNLDDKDDVNLDNEVKYTDRCKEIQEADVNVDDEDNVDLNDKDDVSLDVEADVNLDDKDDVNLNDGDDANLNDEDVILDDEDGVNLDDKDDVNLYEGDDANLNDEDDANLDDEDGVNLDDKDDVNLYEDDVNVDEDDVNLDDKYDANLDDKADLNPDVKADVNLDDEDDVNLDDKDDFNLDEDDVNLDDKDDLNLDDKADLNLDVKADVNLDDEDDVNLDDKDDVNLDEDDVNLDDKDDVNLDDKDDLNLDEDDVNLDDKDDLNLDDKADLNLDVKADVNLDDEDDVNLDDEDDVNLDEDDVNLDDKDDVNLDDKDDLNLDDKDDVNLDDKDYLNLDIEADVNLDDKDDVNLDEDDVNLDDKDDLNLDDEDDVNLDDKDDVNLDVEADVNLDDKDDVNLDVEADVNLDDKDDVNLDVEADVNLDDKDDVNLDDKDDVNLDDKDDVNLDEDDVKLDDKDDVNLDDKDDLNLDDKDDVNLDDKDDLNLDVEADVNLDDKDDVNLDEDDVNLDDKDDLNLDDEDDVNLDDKDDVNLDVEADVNLDDKDDVNLDVEADVNLDDKDDVNLDVEADVNLDDKDYVNLDDKDDVNLDDKDDVNLDDKDDVNLDDKDDLNLDVEADVNLDDEDDVILDDEDDVILDDEDDVNLDDEDDVILDDEDDVNLDVEDDVNLDDEDDVILDDKDDVNLDDKDDVNLDEDGVNLDDEDDVILDDKDDVNLDDKDDVNLNNEDDVNLDDNDDVNLTDKVKDTTGCKVIQEADVNLDDEDDVILDNKDDVILDDVNLDDEDDVILNDEADVNLDDEVNVDLNDEDDANQDDEDGVNLDHKDHVNLTDKDDVNLDDEDDVILDDIDDTNVDDKADANLDDKVKDMAGCKAIQETDLSVDDEDDVNLGDKDNVNLTDKVKDTAECIEIQETDVNVDDEDDVNLVNKDDVNLTDKVKDTARCKEIQDADVNVYDKDDVNLDDEADVNVDDKDDSNLTDKDDVNLDDEDDVILDDEDDVNLVDESAVNLDDEDDANLDDEDDVNLDDKDDVILDDKDDVNLTDKVKDTTGCKVIQEADVNLDDEDDANLNDEDDAILDDEADVNLDDKDNVDLNDEDDANLTDKNDVNLADEDDVILDDANLDDKVKDMAGCKVIQETDVNVDDEDDINLTDKVKDTAGCKEIQEADVNVYDVNLDDEADVNLDDKDNVDLDNEVKDTARCKGIQETVVNVDDEDDINLEDKDETNLDDIDDVNLDDEADVNLEDKADVNLDDEADVNLDEKDDANLDDIDDVNLDDEADVNLEAKDDVNVDHEADVKLDDKDDVNLDDKDAVNLDDEVEDSVGCKVIQEDDVNLDDKDDVNLNYKDGFNLDNKDDVNLEYKDDVNLNYKDDVNLDDTDNVNLDDEDDVNLDDKDDVNLDDKDDVNLDDKDNVNLDDEDDVNLDDKDDVSLEDKNDVNLDDKHDVNLDDEVKEIAGCREIQEDDVNLDDEVEEEHFNLYLSLESSIDHSQTIDPDSEGHESESEGPMEIYNRILNIGPLVQVSQNQDNSEINKVKINVDADSEYGVIQIDSCLNIDAKEEVHCVEEAPCGRRAEIKVAEAVPCNGRAEVKVAEEVPCSGRAEEKVAEEVPCSGRAEVKVAEEVPCNGRAEVKVAEEVPCSGRAEVKVAEEVPCSDRAEVKVAEEVPCSGRAEVKVAEEVPCNGLAEEKVAEEMPSNRVEVKLAEEVPCNGRAEVKLAEEAPCSDRAEEKVSDHRCNSEHIYKEGDKENCNISIQDDMSSSQYGSEDEFSDESDEGEYTVSDDDEEEQEEEEQDDDELLLSERDLSFDCNADVEIDGIQPLINSEDESDVSRSISNKRFTPTKISTPTHLLEKVTHKNYDPSINISVDAFPLDEKKNSSQTNSDLSFTESDTESSLATVKATVSQVITNLDYEENKMHVSYDKAKSADESNEDTSQNSLDDIGEDDDDGDYIINSQETVSGNENNCLIVNKSVSDLKQTVNNFAMSGSPEYSLIYGAESVAVLSDCNLSDDLDAVSDAEGTAESTSDDAQDEISHMIACLEKSLSESQCKEVSSKREKEQADPDVRKTNSVISGADQAEFTESNSSHAPAQCAEVSDNEMQSIESDTDQGQNGECSTQEQAVQDKVNPVSRAEDNIISTDHVKFTESTSKHATVEGAEVSDEEMQSIESGIYQGQNVECSTQEQAVQDKVNPVSCAEDNIICTDHVKFTESTSKHATVEGAEVSDDEKHSIKSNIDQGQIIECNTLKQSVQYKAGSLSCADDNISEIHTVQDRSPSVERYPDECDRSKFMCTDLCADSLPSHVHDNSEQVQPVISRDQALLAECRNEQGEECIIETVPAGECSDGKVPVCSTDEAQTTECNIDQVVSGISIVDRVYPSECSTGDILIKHWDDPEKIESVTTQKTSEGLVDQVQSFNCSSDELQDVDYATTQKEQKYNDKLADTDSCDDDHQSGAYSAQNVRCATPMVKSINSLDIGQHESGKRKRNLELEDRIELNDGQSVEEGKMEHARLNECSCELTCDEPCDKVPHHVSVEGCLQSNLALNCAEKSCSESVKDLTVQFPTYGGMQAIRKKRIGNIVSRFFLERERRKQEELVKRAVLELCCGGESILSQVSSDNEQGNGQISGRYSSTKDEALQNEQINENLKSNHLVKGDILTSYTTSNMTSISALNHDPNNYQSETNKDTFSEARSPAEEHGSDDQRTFAVEYEAFNSQQEGTRSETLTWSSALCQSTPVSTRGYSALCQSTPVSTQGSSALRQSTPVSTRGSSALCQSTPVSTRGSSALRQSTPVSSRGSSHNKRKRGDESDSSGTDDVSHIQKQHCTEIATSDVECQNNDTGKSKALNDSRSGSSSCVDNSMFEENSDDEDNVLILSGFLNDHPVSFCNADMDRTETYSGGSDDDDDADAYLEEMESMCSPIIPSQCFSDDDAGNPNDKQDDKHDRECIINVCLTHQNDENTPAVDELQKDWSAKLEKDQAIENYSSDLDGENTKTASIQQVCESGENIKDCAIVLDSCGNNDHVDLGPHLQLSVVDEKNVDTVQRLIGTRKSLAITPDITEFRCDEIENTDATHDLDKIEHNECDAMDVTPELTQIGCDDNDIKHLNMRHDLEHIEENSRDDSPDLAVVSECDNVVITPAIDDVECEVVAENPGVRQQLSAGKNEDMLDITPDLADLMEQEDKLSVIPDHSGVGNTVQNVNITADRVNVENPSDGNLDVVPRRNETCDNFLDHSMHIKKIEDPNLYITSLKNEDDDKKIATNTGVSAICDEELPRHIAMSVDDDIDETPDLASVGNTENDVQKHEDEDLDDKLVNVNKDDNLDVTSDLSSVSDHENDVENDEVLDNKVVDEDDILAVAPDLASVSDDEIDIEKDKDEDLGDKCVDGDEPDNLDITPDLASAINNENHFEKDVLENKVVDENEDDNVDVIPDLTLASNTEHDDDNVNVAPDLTSISDTHKQDDSDVTSDLEAGNDNDVENQDKQVVKSDLDKLVNEKEDENSDIATSLTAAKDNENINVKQELGAENMTQPFSDYEDDIEKEIDDESVSYDDLHQTGYIKKDHLTVSPDSDSMPLSEVDIFEVNDVPERSANNNLCGSENDGSNGDSRHSGQCAMLSQTSRQSDQPSQSSQQSQASQPSSQHTPRKLSKLSLKKNKCKMLSDVFSSPDADSKPIVYPDDVNPNSATEICSELRIHLLKTEPSVDSAGESGTSTNIIETFQSLVPYSCGSDTESMDTDVDCAGEREESSDDDSLPDMSQVINRHAERDDKTDAKKIHADVYSPKFSKPKRKRKIISVELLSSDESETELSCSKKKKTVLLSVNKTPELGVPESESIVCGSSPPEKQIDTSLADEMASLQDDYFPNTQMIETFSETQLAASIKSCEYSLSHIPSSSSDDQDPTCNTVNLREMKVPNCPVRKSAASEQYQDSSPVSTISSSESNTHVQDIDAEYNGDQNMSSHRSATPHSRDSSLPAEELKVKPPDRRKAFLDKLLKRRNQIKREVKTEMTGGWSASRSVGEPVGTGLPSSPNDALQRVQTQIQKCSSLLHSISENLTNLSVQHIPRIHTWRSEIVELMKRIKTGPDTIIAVVGDTGSGKSCLLNALLDHSSVLPTSGIRACTAVVVEISNNTQNNFYEADIEFLSREEWFHELQILLTDMTGPDGRLRKAAPDPKSDRGVSYSKIKAVYGKVDKLEALRSMGYNVTKWLGRTRIIQETRPKELKRKIEAYIESSDAGKGGQFWPIVRQVSVRIPNSAVCSSGAKLVDLPGIRDSNAARDQIAKQYLKNCTAVWVVASIHRAIDDKTAKDLLGETFRRQLLMDGQYGSVSFICTKTDVLIPSEIIRQLDLHSKCSVLAKELVDAESARKIKQEELDTLNAELSSLDDEFAEVHRECMELRNLNTEAKTLLTEDSEESAGDSEDLAQMDELEKELSGKEACHLEMEDSVHDKKVDVRDKDKEVFEVDQKITAIHKSLAALCAKERNEYSRTQIRRDFRAGLREMKRKAGLTGQDDDVDDDNDDDDPLSQSLLQDDNEQIGSTADNAKVFCVSAAEFLKMRHLMPNDGPPQVFSNQDDTEIPALCEHVHHMTSVRHKTHVSTSIQSIGRLVGDMNNYVLHGRSKDKALRVNAQAIIDSEVNKLQCRFEVTLGSLSFDIINSFNLHLHPSLADGVTKAMQTAQETSDKWAAPVNKDNKHAGGLRWNTYKAVCRRGGAFKSTGCGVVDFNEQLSEPVFTCLSIGWDKVFSAALWKVVDKFSSNIMSLLSAFSKNTLAELVKLGINLDSIKRADSQVVLSTRNKLKESVTRLKELITKQQRDISRLVVPTIKTSMLSTYDTCAGQCGSGIMNKLKQAMAIGIETNKPSMFCDASQQVIDELVQIQAAIVVHLQETCTQICQDLRAIYEPLWEAPSNSQILQLALGEGVTAALSQIHELYRDVGIPISVSQQELSPPTPSRPIIESDVRGRDQRHVSGVASGSRISSDGAGNQSKIHPKKEPMSTMETCNTDESFTYIVNRVKQEPQTHQRNTTKTTSSLPFKQLSGSASPVPGCSQSSANGSDSSQLFSQSRLRIPFTETQVHTTSCLDCGQAHGHSRYKPCSKHKSTSVKSSKKISIIPIDKPGINERDKQAVHSRDPSFVVPRVSSHGVSPVACTKDICNNTDTDKPVLGIKSEPQAHGYENRARKRRRDSDVIMIDLTESSDDEVATRPSKTVRRMVSSKHKS